MDVYSLIALIIYSSFLLFAILATLIYGLGNFNKIEMNGPYEVGHKDAWNNKNGLGMSIWFPMDREEHARTITISGRNTYWLRYGYKSRAGIAAVTSDWGKDNAPHPWFYKYLDDIKMDTVTDGLLAKDFRTGK